MFMEWGKRLSEAFGALEVANHELGLCLRADAALPVLLPTYTGSPEPLARREAVVATLTRMLRSDNEAQLLEAGLVCASSDTLVAARVVNDAKAVVKDAITRLREEIHERHQKIGQNLRIDHLLQRALARESDPKRLDDLSQLLRNLDLKRIDLIACYTQIRILEPRVNSISWTWARTRYSGERVTHKEALQMAEALEGDEKVNAMAAINRFPSHAMFMQVKTLPALQLRANLVIQDRNPPAKAISVSGPVLSPDTTLPRYVWRDRPADGQPPARLKRSDTLISEQPFVPALKLHSYVQGENA